MIIGGDPTDERREPLNCPDEVAHSVLYTEIISSTIAFATSRYACSSRSRSRRRPIGLGQDENGWHDGRNCRCHHRFHFRNCEYLQIRRWSKWHHANTGPVYGRIGCHFRVLHGYRQCDSIRCFPHRKRGFPARTTTTLHHGCPESLSTARTIGHSRCAAFWGGYILRAESLHAAISFQNP